MNKYGIDSKHPAIQIGINVMYPALRVDIQLLRNRKGITSAINLIQARVQIVKILEHTVVVVTNGKKEQRNAPYFQPGTANIMNWK